MQTKWIPPKVIEEKKNNIKYNKSNQIKCRTGIKRRTILSSHKSALGSLVPAKWPSFDNFVNSTVARTLFPVDFNETTERIDLRSSPFRASLTAHSPTGTLWLSPKGPIAMVMALGIPVDFRTSTTHSASSVYSKNYEKGEHIRCTFPIELDKQATE